jgi:aryl-alcohol dehydrogenase
LAYQAMLPAGVPAVFGHESTGIVEATGADITDVKTGDHVVLTYTRFGTCAQCAAGQPPYCERFQALNGAGRRPDRSATLSGQDGDLLVWPG